MKIKILPLGIWIARFEKNELITMLYLMTINQKKEDQKMNTKHPVRRSLSTPWSRLPLFSFFDEFADEESTYMPAVNIAEDEKSFHVEVSAAGFKKEDFKVEADNGFLTISAEHKEEEKKDGKNYSRREFRYGTFRRSFRLDEEKVDLEHVSVRYENGILNVTVPKKAPKKENARTFKVE